MIYADDKWIAIIKNGAAILINTVGYYIYNATDTIPRDAMRWSISTDGVLVRYSDGEVKELSIKIPQGVISHCNGHCCAYNDAEVLFLPTGWGSQPFSIPCKGRKEGLIPFKGGASMILEGRLIDLYLSGEQVRGPKWPIADYDQYLRFERRHASFNDKRLAFCEGKEVIELERVK